MKKIEIFKNCKILVVLLIILSITCIYLLCQNITLGNYVEQCESENECGNPEELSLIHETTARELVGIYSNDLSETERIIPTKPYFEIDNLGDSKTVWFSYKEISNYLCLIKNQFVLSPTNNIEDLGIRVYFGRYPKLETNGSGILSDNTSIVTRDLYGVPKNYSYRHCLVFVPTGKGKKDAILDVKGTNNILLLGNNKNHGNLAPPESIIGENYIQN